MIINANLAFIFIYAMLFVKKVFVQPLISVKEIPCLVFRCMYSLSIYSFWNENSER